MTHKPKFQSLVLVLCVGFAGSLQAQTAPSGRTIAHQGAGSAPACEACHAAPGLSYPSLRAPHLAGQPEQYLRQQLEYYSQGTLRDAVMWPIAKTLTSAQRHAVAAYYAGLAPASDTRPHRRAQMATADEARGRQLAEVGDVSLSIPACNACHQRLPHGQTTIPYLAGQPDVYLVDTLHALQSGVRATPNSGAMQAIAKQLSDADIQAVAAYYAQQPLPATAAR